MTTTSREPCPQCRAEGRDRSGDNLIRFPEGNAFCHACGYKERKGKTTEETVTYSKLTADQITKHFPVLTTKHRDISVDVLNEYNIRRAEYW